MKPTAACFAQFAAENARWTTVSRFRLTSTASAENAILRSLNFYLGTTKSTPCPKPTAASFAAFARFAAENARWNTISRFRLISRGSAGNATVGSWTFRFQVPSY